MSEEPTDFPTDFHDPLLCTNREDCPQCEEYRDALDDAATNEDGADWRWQFEEDPDRERDIREDR